MTSNQKSATTAVGDFEGISSAAKRDSPSAQRNKEPIWNVLSSKVLPVITGNSSNNDNNSPIRVLEVAAGSGVHAHYFALHMSQNNQYHQPVCFEWYPTDPDLVCRNSIQAHIDDEPTTRLKGMLQSPVELLLDENGIIATEDNETVRKTTFHLMTCINMIHISPWTATEGLMKVAGEQLVKGGILYLYGPYKVGGTSAESNL